MRPVGKMLACATLLALGAPADGDPWRQRGCAASETDGGPTVLEDRPQPLAPRRARSESDHDQLDAATRFAHGRLLLHRNELPQALRQFERAWRADPEAAAILQEIVSLAGRLGRHDEAARYAVLLAQRRPLDPELLTQLAAWLTEQRDLRRAVLLFEQALLRFDQQEQQLRALALRVELGRLYTLLGEHRQAAAVFTVVHRALSDPQQAGISQEQLARLIQDPKPLQELMAETFLEAARLEDAERIFRHLHQSPDDESLLAFQLARVDAARGQVAAAREKLEQYFEAGQSAAGLRPYQLLADLLRRTHDQQADAAAALIEQLSGHHGRDSDNAPLAYYLAGQFRQASRWGEAEEMYRDLLGSQPAAEAFQGLAEIYLRQRKPMELLEILADSLDKTGSTETVATQMAEITEDGPFLVELLDLVARRVEQSPQSVRQNSRLAAALLAIGGGEFDRAEALYRRTLECEGLPRHEVMERVALAMFLADQPQRAAEIFQEAIDQNPPGAQLAAHYFYLAGALEMADHTDTALRAAEKAAALDDSVRFQSRAPWIAYHAKRYALAEQGYRELLERFDAQYESPEVRETLRDARLVLSHICVLGERMADAEEWLEQVLDEFPEDVGALNDLGYLWADQGRRLERALSMVRKAVEAEPDNAAYRDSLGWAYFRLGRHAEAVAELERAAAGERPDGVILDHLGDAYLGSGQQEKAMQTWRRALESFDPHNDARILEATQEKIQRYQAEKP